LIFQQSVSTAIEVRVLREVIERFGWSIEPSGDVMTFVVTLPSL